MNIKAVLLLSFIVGLSGAASAKAGGKAETVSFKADDSHITYIGRTISENGEVTFDWCGVYARVEFSGGYLELDAVNTGECWFSVWIDKDTAEEPDQVFLLKGEERHVLFNIKEKKAQTHKAVIMRRNDSDFGVTTFRSFTVEGSLLQAEPMKERVIEFIGDSYTSGDGTELSRRDDPFNSRWQNPGKTWANILARYFGADYIRTSHSGQGIDRNYDDVGRGYVMADRYLETLDSRPGTTWHPSGIKPAITIIYLGTNDFSTQRQPTFPAFRENYMRLLREIKANYGEDHPILCVASKHDWYCHDFIQETVRWCGMKNVHFAALFGAVHDDDGDLGAAWHPNYTGQKKKAYALLPYVATITGWGLEEKVVE